MDTDIQQIFKIASNSTHNPLHFKNFINKQSRHLSAKMRLFQVKFAKAKLQMDELGFN